MKTKPEGTIDQEATKVSGRLQRLVMFIFKSIFNWAVMWCGLALFCSHHGKPYMGMGCLLFWILFMILAELKELNRKLTFKT